MSRIARWILVPGAFALALGVAVPTADAGTRPKRKIQASNFYFCGIHRDSCNSGDTGFTRRVVKGTRVTWIYKDTACDAYYPTCPGHDVKVGTRAVSATVHTQGAVIYSMIFRSVGTFHFRCTHHVNQGMTGKIIVRAA